MLNSADTLDGLGISTDAPSGHRNVLSVGNGVIMGELISTWPPDGPDLPAEGSRSIDRIKSHPGMPNKRMRGNRWPHLVTRGALQCVVPVAKMNFSIPHEEGLGGSGESAKHFVQY